MVVTARLRASRKHLVVACSPDHATGSGRERGDIVGSYRKTISYAPISIAPRELRLFGKYCVLFSVDDKDKLVTIILVGEKRGNRLLVLGEEFTEHHAKRRKSEARRPLAHINPDVVAEQQGVKPIDNPEELFADFWPKEETAAQFIHSVREWRRQGDKSGST